MWPTTMRALFCFLALNSITSSTAISNRKFNPDVHSEKTQRVTRGFVSMKSDNSGFQFSEERPSNGGLIIAEGSTSPPSDHRSNFGKLEVITNGFWHDRIQMRGAGYVEGWLTAVDNESLDASTSPPPSTLSLIHNSWLNYKDWFDSTGNNTDVVVRWLEAQDVWLEDQLHKHYIEDEDIESRELSKEDVFWEGIRFVTLQLDGIVNGYNGCVESLKHGGKETSMETLPRELNDLIPWLMPNSDTYNVLDLDRLGPSEALTRLATSGHCSSMIRVTGDLQDIIMGHNTWTTYYTMVRLFKHYSLNLKSPFVKNRGITMSSYPGVISSIDDFFILDSGLMYNSGTYNNQNMIVDLNKFEPGKALQTGLLTVTELAPGSVSDVKSMGNLLRHAKWSSNGTWGDGTPWSSLCARGDLLADGPKAYGCIDAKVTSFSMALKRSALVVGGPSFGGGLAPFSWSKSKGFPKGSHLEMPDTYETSWEVMEF
eukprot:gene16276-22456_t